MEEIIKWIDFTIGKYIFSMLKNDSCTVSAGGKHQGRKMVCDTVMLIHSFNGLGTGIVWIITARHKVQYNSCKSGHLY